MQPVDHPPHGRSFHQWHVSIKDQHVAIESGERGLGLEHGVAGAKLRLLCHYSDIMPGYRLFDLLTTCARPDHLPFRTQRTDDVQQVRSEERRVGKECVSPGRSRGEPYT